MCSVGKSPKKVSFSNTVLFKTEKLIEILKLASFSSSSDLFTAAAEEKFRGGSWAAAAAPFLASWNSRDGGYEALRWDAFDNHSVIEQCIFKHWSLSCVICHFSRSQIFLRGPKKKTTHLDRHYYSLLTNTGNISWHVFFRAKTGVTFKEWETNIWRSLFSKNK